MSPRRSRLVARLRSPGAVVASGRAARLAVELVTTTLLMRWLGPAPFGLVAMATAVLSALAAVGDAGVGSSLVSERGPLPRRTGAAALLAVALAAGTALLALALTPLVVRFYGDERIGPLWAWCCLSLACSPLLGIPHALAQRDERFAPVAFVPVAGALLGGVAALVLARSGAGPFALVARLVVSTALTAALFWVVVRPRLERPTRADVAEVYRFARGVVGFDVINVLARNADNVIVGRALGERALGLYGLGYRVLTLPLSQLGTVARTVTYPRLARLAPDPSAVARGLGQSMRQLAWLTTPLSLGIALAAEELILVVVDATWLEALVPFRILAVLAVIQAPVAQLHLAYTVSRRTDRMARWALFTTPVIVASFFVGLPWGITGVAASYALTSVGISVGALRNAAGTLGVPTRAVAAGAVRGVAEGLLITVPLALAHFAAGALEASPTVRLAVTVGAGALSVVPALLRMRAPG